MIAQALAKYLMDPTELTGWPANRFESDQNVSGFVLRTPNDARRMVQDRVNRQNIFHGRRPQGSDWSTAITLLELDESPEYGVAGEAPGTDTALLVTVYGRGASAAQRVNAVASFIRLACSGCHNVDWDDINCGECRVTGGGLALDPPVDATDQWEYARSLELEIWHGDPQALFPAYELFGDFAFRDAINVGLYLRLASFCFPAPNRPIVDIRWEVRVDGFGGDPLVTINGPPESTITDANVVGSYKEPEFLRSAFGLTEATYVKMVLTDDFGTTFTIRKTEGDPLANTISIPCNCPSGNYEAGCLICEGGGGSGADVIFGEELSGVLNGSNVTFTTQFPFVPGKINPKVNGVDLLIVDDFVTVGTNTVLLNVAPLSGESVTADYVRGI